MTPGRGGGLGSAGAAGSRGSAGGRKMGFLEAQIRRAAGEDIPVYNNMTADVEESSDTKSQNGDKNNSEVTGDIRDQSGLNPRRIRGFGGLQRNNNSQAESPSLNDMRARQSAIVAKVMTFYKRKSTLVIEMYEGCFYKQKPRWDQIANFIYKDLCPMDDLRKAVKDVQLHPVKMLIFIRFAEDRFRDYIVSKIRHKEGIIWSDYKVKVKGYSLDSEVKFIRLLGISPETEASEIIKVFKDDGIGDVVEIRKGLLDNSRLPGVTNGT